MQLVNRFTPTNGKAPSSQELQTWMDAFHAYGYIVLHNVLTSDQCKTLCADLDRVLETEQDNGGGAIELKCRMFESSSANLDLFTQEPLVTFAEYLIDKQCHVIHNNSFRVKSGKGITTWHQDDPPHYIVTSGTPPTNVHLPVLLFTCNYYLTDVDSPEFGPTECLPGSHLFGKVCPSTLDGTGLEEETDFCCGKAGTVVCFNNQVWHRGALNLSDRVRYITQISYARRIIGHKYFPFMNYQLPADLMEVASRNPRLQRLLGFLPSGAYG